MLERNAPFHAFRTVSQLLVKTARGATSTIFKLGWAGIWPIKKYLAEYSELAEYSVPHMSVFS